MYMVNTTVQMFVKKVHTARIISQKLTKRSREPLSAPFITFLDISVFGGSDSESFSEDTQHDKTLMTFGTQYHVLLTERIISKRSKTQTIINTTATIQLKPSLVLPSIEYHRSSHLFRTS
jgi:hypothetical protein